MKQLSLKVGSKSLLLKIRDQKGNYRWLFLGLSLVKLIERLLVFNSVVIGKQVWGIGHRSLKLIAT